MLLKLFLLAILPLAFAYVNETVSASYDSNQAQIGLWLSAAAYCGKSTYQSRTFKGPTTGFVVTSVVADTASDTQGFVGYLPSDKSIYVVFRGSSSIRNWISNLDAWKTSYTSFPDCNCQVHKGFYQAEQKVIGGIISQVKTLKAKFPNYAVKTTGHSLGMSLFPSLLSLSF